MFAFQVRRSLPALSLAVRPWAAKGQSRALAAASLSASHPA